MNNKNVKGIMGWLLVYIILSIPVLFFYSMGLSGWFFEYPIVLMILIFVLFAIPLLLVLLKSPKAPKWNIIVLWAAAILMTLRAISVILFPGGGQPPMSGEELWANMPMLAGIVVFSIGWAITWTLYFKKSMRVKNTFGK